jgi:hypothetical protein
MPEMPDRTRRTRWTAILLLIGLASSLAAEESAQARTQDKSDVRISSIQAALAKIDLNFRPVVDSIFAFDSESLRITIKADKPVLYKGESFQNGAPQSGVYGPVHVSDKFYGVERVLHYALSQAGVPYGGVQVQERVTVLYENMLRRPLRPRAFDSKPFVIGKDGTFQDRQVMGHFDTPWPENALQILKQELILDGELVATIYIMRTTKDIRVAGYSVPPLMPNFAASSGSEIGAPKGKK